jgi:hypothetical protein
MNAKTNTTQRCTCQLCVQNWQLVDGAFEPTPAREQEPVETPRREAPLRQTVQAPMVMRPELNRVYV